MNSRLSFWLLVFATVCFCQQAVWCRPADEDDSYQDDNMDNTDTEDYNQDESDAGEEDVKGPPPKFLNDPQKERKKQGESVEFKCDVANANDLVIMWLNGSSMLFLDGDPQIKDPRVKLINKNTLHIDNVQWYDSGNYSCEVSSYPDSLRILHVLEVLEPATITRVLPNKNYFIRENETLGLECSVSGYPIPEVTWHRKNNVMPSGVKEEKSDRLTYESVSRNDSGVYECVAKNDLGEDRAQVNVTVRYPPIIHIERELVPAGLNYETVLKCEADAEPRPSLKWRRKNDFVKSDQNVFIRNEGNVIELKITKTDESHFGEYECEARNNLGTERRKITVSGIPGEAVWKGSETVKDDDWWADLSWTVESYSPIEEYLLKFRRVGRSGWQEEKPEVANPEGNIYSVTHRLKLPAPGEYEAILLSYNKYGWSPAPRPAHRFTTDFLAAEAAANELSSEPEPQPGGASDTRPTFFLLHYFFLISSTLLILY